MPLPFRRIGAGATIFCALAVGFAAAAEERESTPRKPHSTEDSRPEGLREEPPTSRLDAWVRPRLRKRDRLEPYKPALLERQLLALEKAERPRIFDINYKGLYPSVNSISSGSRLAPGVRLWHPDIGASSVSVHATAAFSLAGYELFELEAGRIPHEARRLPLRSTKGDNIYELGQIRRSALSHLILYTSLRYRHNPRERFYGLGADSRKEDRSSFLLQDASYDLVLGYQPTTRMVATLRTGYLQAFVGPGREETLPTTQQLFTNGDAPGLLRQPDFWRLVAQLLLDHRDQPFNPHSGGMLALSFSRLDDRGGDEFRFRRFAADARGYVSLGSPQRVLALRLYTSLDEAPKGSRVPFYLQEALSNGHTLRGYETFRFRGEKLLSLQGEYRWEAIPVLEFTVFLDAGKAFQDLSDWNLERLRTGYGFGVRLKTYDNTLFRVDTARSREGTRLYLAFSASF